MNNFGIPRNHIFHSRDATFLPDVMRETNGRGVDIVLNSLSGELLHASWKCVAEFGTMVEIGRRDFVGQGMLAMDMFESNRSFVGLDLLQISTDRPSRINKQVSTSYESDELTNSKKVSCAGPWGTTRKVSSNLYHH